MYDSILQLIKQSFIYTMLCLIASPTTHINQVFSCVRLRDCIETTKSDYVIMYNKLILYIKVVFMVTGHLLIRDFEVPTR